MRTCEEILSLYLQRKNAAGPMMSVMRSVRDVYNGDVVVPLPERESTEKVAVANLMKMGLDQMADRVASVVPDVRFPLRRPGIKTEEQRVADRRRAVLGWWDRSLMTIKLYRRGRHFMGYGCSPVLIRPDYTDWRYGAPRWEVRNPLGTYPGEGPDPDDPQVPDCIFAVYRSLGWLKSRYDIDALCKGSDARNPDARFEVLEYIDGDELVTCVVGKDPDMLNSPLGAPAWVGSRVVELERLPNRAGMCTAVVPGRVNLDRRGGQFDAMIGMYQAQARLFALEQIAVEQGVFPDEWLVARQGETPEILQVADGRTGVVGMVKGGDLRQQQNQPGYLTNPTIDRLERAQRLSGGIPADFGGESSSNVRTGRRGENILAATIDFTLLHAQRIMGASLEAENRCAIAVDKGYHDTAKSFYVQWYKAKGQVDYTPSVLFDSDQNIVTYASAGADANAHVIGALQRNGAGTLSKEGFMEIDPLIDDVELEKDRVVAESLEAAMLSGIQQQAASGQIPPADVARIATLVRQNKMNVAEAITKTQEEAQERQAKLVEAQSPEAQPGLAVPGAGAESTPIPDQPLGPSIGNLAELLSSLRRPHSLTAPAEAMRPEAMV